MMESSQRMMLLEEFTEKMLPQGMMFLEESTENLAPCEKSGYVVSCEESAGDDDVRGGYEASRENVLAA